VNAQKNPNLSFCYPNAIFAYMPFRQITQPVNSCSHRLITQLFSPSNWLNDGCLTRPFRTSRWTLANALLCILKNPRYTRLWLTQCKPI
jgi:hypothetical protein